MVDGNNDDARKLAILGVLLQALHVLFGITAIIGMFINHMLIERSHNTIYHSHIRWQLTTFWVCAALYFITFLIWRNYGLVWPFTLVLVFSLYRIASSAYELMRQRPIDRLL